MKTFAIVALKRHGLTDSVVGLRKDEEEARRTASQHMVAMADEFVRCRVRPVDLSVADVKALCYRWGVEAALAGEPVTNELPGVAAPTRTRGGTRRCGHRRSASKCVGVGCPKNNDGRRNEHGEGSA